MEQVRAYLQLGKKNQMLINETRNTTQKLEVQMDLFASLALIAVSIFILVVILLFKSKSLSKYQWSQKMSHKCQSTPP